jgi:hypothetical protein
MRFTDTEIQLATRMRGAGLVWEPAAGHYVFDIDGVVKAASPFQAGVFLISSPNAMERLVGGADDLHARFAWLPTWSDARDWLDARGASRQSVVDALQAAVASKRSDLEAIYSVVLANLAAAGEKA